MDRNCMWCKYLDESSNKAPCNACTYLEESGEWSKFEEYSIKIKKGEKENEED